MLPGPDCFWIAQRNWRLGTDGTHEIGNDPVSGPVSTADDIAAAGVRDQHTIAPRRERRAIRGGDQFGTSFRCAIGIFAPERIVFAIAPEPFLIPINLVCGDTDHRLHAWRQPS